MNSEQKILKLPHKYLVFIDEVGDPFLHKNIEIYKNPSIFSVMTITAMVITRIRYRNILMPGLDKIKEYFFNNKEVYFHSREIRRKDGIFKIFLNEKIYTDFKNKMNNLLKQSSISLISSSINKIKLLKKAKKFKKSSSEEYNIGDLYLRNVDYVLERIGHLVSNKNTKIIFETRGKKESKRIQSVLSDVKLNGNFYCPKERFNGIDKTILFFAKKNNINGLQVVDYLTYPFARHAKNPNDKDNKFFDILRQYIYRGNYGEYGLKEWP